MLLLNQDELQNIDNKSLSILWDNWIKHKKNLKGKAMRLTGGDPDAAEELLSATILKAANHFEHKEVDLREPRAFFLYALKNEFISQYRKKKYEFQYRISEIDVYEDRLSFANNLTTEQDHQLQRRQQLGEVQQALTTLPDIYQRIFTMKFVEERSYPEISEDLEISQALARKRVQFLRQKLRHLVKWNYPSSL
ncbi:RNA polymerase sigma factor [Flexibacterium corallicola]|uniref:RNA polymerase sigma factor n=1 Tax=Flexibacterium corallicola TaxID=3037259 RepID=UPI00286F2E3A|nr:RNA polymerase sigma factor [Pseudovibrio sp. M1P-2-3]